MVFSAKSNNNNEGWGMGFLLILFHHHPDGGAGDTDNNNAHHSPFTKKKASFSLSSPSFAAKSTNLLLSKTQSTLSICGILVFTTLLLFTLSTFEPTSVLHHHAHPLSRRFLTQQQEQESKKHSKISKSNTVFSYFSLSSTTNAGNFTRIATTSPALHRMGALYLRGSKAMTDLVVGHVAEDTTEKELTTFLRVIQHSGLLSRSDIVFIFSSAVAESRFGRLLKSECDSFLRLVQLGGELGKFTELNSGLTRYSREVGEGEKEPMWGRKRVNSTDAELTRSSYGSVMSFDASELDPEDTLSGFLDHVPMSLRRWASYPMLLGRVRRQFKHILLVDVKSKLILSDPFSRVRNRTSESVFLWSNSDAELTRHHGKRNSGKGREAASSPKAQLNPGIIVGGSRGVRRFASAALTEIVRVVIEHKGRGRSLITESGLVNQLVHSGHLLKNIILITPTESMPELSSLTGLKSVDSGSNFLKLSDYFSVVQRGHSSSGGGSFDIDNVVIKEICASHKLYSSVYSDCLSS
ncbi:hypothetical protein BVRB_3g061590 [Beta vulgaris subsp. vulgaris]|uniref:uncharacterized protein LOC104889360 n=1 Tax=Beta vulgaris subsp. vulgaris TaxID=3555 RepID=UPI00053FE7E1|nr:uncharacterized protein LOC104889360 [Beta vulgaris subsp. vulgaris]KMT15035.1 hypothetical protein BVRB_3g061590 [Beta vulgaris subsp. vulgaris]